MNPRSMRAPRPLVLALVALTASCAHHPPALLDAGNPDTGFLAAKIGTARFFADHILSQAPALCHAIVSGAAGALALEDAQF